MIYGLNIYKKDEKGVDIGAYRVETELPIEPFIGMQIDFFDKEKYLIKSIVIEDVICKLYEGEERKVVLVCKETGSWSTMEKKI